MAHRRTFRVTAEPWYAREQRQWGIRAARKPHAHPYLASAVLVLAPEGKGYCYVSFSEKFVEAVGMAMLWGVGPEHPAHLKVMYRASTDSWLVFAKYLDSIRFTTLLWEQKGRPEWAIRRVKP
jgi:hypothetical protein